MGKTEGDPRTMSDDREDPVEKSPYMVRTVEHLRTEHQWTMQSNPHAHHVRLHFASDAPHTHEWKHVGAVSMVADWTEDPFDDRAQEMVERARAFSLWINSTYPEGLCEEAVAWRRVTKGGEEAGEVQDALRAYFGENPRKPRGPLEDVLKELADEAASALGALEHLTGHQGHSVDIVLDRMRETDERVGLIVKRP